jgi:hypothetical protein
VNVRQALATSAAAAMALLPAGCARVKVDPIEVKTIHIVHDINIKVDRELDEFFAFQERAGAAATAPATTAPATTAPATTGPAATAPATTRTINPSGAAR